LKISQLRALFLLANCGARMRFTGRCTFLKPRRVRGLRRTISAAETFRQHGAKQVKVSDLSRFALSSCVAAAMLAGCGGSQPPIGAPGAMAQTSATAAHADRGTSGVGARNLSGSFGYNRIVRHSLLVSDLPQQDVAERPDFSLSKPLLYVVNYDYPQYSDGVTIYDPTENDPSPTAVITKGFNFPGTACIDSDGTLYVTNTNG
jgi:hypothetical protein